MPLLDRWYDGATRSPLMGSGDRGDFILPGESRFVLEAKNVKIMALPQWLREAKKEADNAGAIAGAVVHKRKGVTAPGSQYLTMTLGDFLMVVNRER